MDGRSVHRSLIEIFRYEAPEFVPLPTRNRVSPLRLPLGFGSFARGGSAELNGLGEDDETIVVHRRHHGGLPGDGLRLEQR